MAERIDCRVDGLITVRQASAALTHALCREFSYVNPEHVRAARFGNAAGFPPRISCAQERSTGDVALPRGDVARVRACLAVRGIEPNWIDQRSRGLDLDVPQCRIEPRDYQAEAMRALVGSVQGLVVLPCAGGKTTVGLLAINELRRTTLILVHTDDLADQWCEGLRERLGLEPGRVKAGHYKFSRVTVASIPTILKHLDDHRLGKFGLVILDECHHAPAATFSAVLAALPARWRLGLTATPQREDRIPVEWFMGPIICQRTAAELIEAGHLMRPDIERVDSGFEFTSTLSTQQKIPALERALVLNDARNDLIVALATRDARCEESILVLTNRVDHVAKLGKLIAAQGVRVGTITGRTAKGRRKEVLAQLKSGELDCAVATKLADEGLDVPRLSRILLAFPLRAEGATVQRVGRLMRQHKGKRPRLYDIVDARVPTLVRRWQARARAYRKLGLMD